LLPCQLYKLDNDPYEQVDLWDEYPGIVKELNKLLEEIKKKK